ncbi:MFS transporter [Streptomyces sp. R28]|uniref:MFS transporter n=1 Tax=Streptomyces sp. R28 TaxID=3238628 RepID=A0AB39Q834_9ACTN
MNWLRSLLPRTRPVWVLALSTLARSTGNGVVVAVIVLYLTRSVGIDATRVGLGLTVAAVVGMVASIPAGHATDVIGARNTAIASVVLHGATICCYAFVEGFVGLLIAAGLVAVAESASNASRGALVALAVPQKERVRTRAYLRSVTNVGFSVGALLGGLALATTPGRATRWRSSAPASCSSSPDWPSSPWTARRPFPARRTPRPGRC